MLDMSNVARRASQLAAAPIVGLALDLAVAQEANEQQAAKIVDLEGRLASTTAELHRARIGADALAARIAELEGHTPADDGQGGGPG